MADNENSAIVATLVGIKECPACGSTFSWDSPDDTYYVKGNRVVECTECGFKNIINDVEEYLTSTAAG